MIASKVIPPAEVEGKEVDGAKGVGGAVVLNRLERNCVLLSLTVATSMAHITRKWSEMGKGTEKWCKTLVIVEGNISLSRDVVSL